MTQAAPPSRLALLELGQLLTGRSQLLLEVSTLRSVTLGSDLLLELLNLRLQLTDTVLVHLNLPGAKHHPFRMTPSCAHRTATYEMSREELPWTYFLSFYCSR